MIDNTLMAYYLFMKEAQSFASNNEHFDAYEAWNQICEDDDFMRDLNACQNIEELNSVVERMSDHYIW